MCIRAVLWRAWVFLLLWLWCLTSPCLAQGQYSISTNASRPTMDFNSGEVAFAKGQIAPIDGWQQRNLPTMPLRKAAQKITGDEAIAWHRFAFDRSQLSTGPLALELNRTSERFVVNLNGVDIYRNYGDPNVQVYGWNRPWLVSLPPQLLLPKNNILIIRVSTNFNSNLGIGTLRIGDDQVLRDHYKSALLAQNTGPQVVNGILISVLVVVLLSWSTRRQEGSILWLALIGILWWVRNLHYYVDSPPFEASLFWDVTVYSMFALMIALYGFAATFINVPHRNRVIAIFSIVGFFLIGLRAFQLSRHAGDMISYLLTIPMALSIIFILAQACWQRPEAKHIMMLLALTVAIGFSFHDFGLLLGVWRGADFYLQPYGSIFVCGVWGMALWSRMLSAMSEVEELNSTLETRVEIAVHRLEQSEAARRDLEVASALEQERDRIMREIHDGIGSDLITALTTAERRKEAPGTIAILRKSITDLKIAVDSLEPIEGDVVSLLANMRHRLEPELKDAGFSFDWDVEDVPPLNWLDAVGALHILRILQEAIGNILSHSGAETILVQCNVALNGYKEGVAITIADRGVGFDASVQTRGKGLANMRSRAAAIHGEFCCSSELGRGTTLKLWLPVNRMASLTLCPTSAATLSTRDEQYNKR
jgi:signal transduction histidine kinase